MKKILIGTVVTGLILFFWQFISWGVGNLHGSQMAYTPLQDEILECINSKNLPEGEYFLPNFTPESSGAEREKVMENYLGKPWALVKYKHVYENTMAMNMIRGLVIDLLCGFLICFVLLGDRDLNFGKVMKTCLVVGVIAYLTIPYLNAIWFKTNSLPDLIDAFVPWALIGAFLGWLLPEKKR